MGIVLEGMAEHVIEREVDCRHVIGHNGRNVRLHIKKGTECKLPGLTGAFAGGQMAAGIKHTEAHLQHIVLADAAHTPLGLRHLVEFLCRLQVLLGYAYLFACQQQIEEQADGLHGHLLRFGEESRLGLTIAQRLDAAVPLQVVHTEQRLREGDGYGQRHELVGPLPASPRRGGV